MPVQSVASGPAYFSLQMAISEDREAFAFVDLSKEIAVFSSRCAENLANEQKNGTPW